MAITAIIKNKKNIILFTFVVANITRGMINHR
jgi:hypothetical protein